MGYNIIPNGALPASNVGLVVVLVVHANSSQPLGVEGGESNGGAFANSSHKEASRIAVTTHRSSSPGQSRKSQTS